MTATLAWRVHWIALSRITIAGGGWGLALAASFLAMSAQECGLPCAADVAMTVMLCVGAGLLTIGPFAAIVKRRSEHP